MGNALRSLCGGRPGPSLESESLDPHEDTPTTVGVSSLACDLFYFEINSQVPEGLSKHVVSSKKIQANWYTKLLAAWKQAKPPPKTPEEAARLVIQILKSHQKADVEGLLAFYGLPPPNTLEQEVSSTVPSSWPQGVKFEMQTLPVSGKAVVDGDGITVYVDTAEPRESSSVPIEVHEAMIRRSNARTAKNYTEADTLLKSIGDAGYRILKGPNNVETLARKYRIRLRGIDAPENDMSYGKEAKVELAKLVEGKCLKVHVYGEDQYGRWVGDVYCKGVFVQEHMLKRGLAWHYIAYDRRPEFAMWEKEARVARVGLWASSNPEKPWDWRKDRRSGGG